MERLLFTTITPDELRKLIVESVEHVHKNSVKGKVLFTAMSKEDFHAMIINAVNACLKAERNRLNNSILTKKQKNKQP